MNYFGAFRVCDIQPFHHEMFCSVHTFVCWSYTHMLTQSCQDSSSARLLISCLNCQPKNSRGQACIFYCYSRSTFLEFFGRSLPCVSPHIIGITDFVRPTFDLQFHNTCKTVLVLLNVRDKRFLATLVNNCSRNGMKPLYKSVGFQQHQKW